MSVRFTVIAGVALSALALMSAPASAADITPEQAARLTAGANEAGPRVDYEAFTMILNSVVLDVGHSNRRPAGRQLRITGSRLSPESNSVYRYEGNRVALHLFEDIHDETISEYRAELEALPQQVALSELSRNEQLAYWLNLHNLVIIDLLQERYPLRRIDREDIDGVPLLDAPVVTVDGVTMSLNDIRLRVVAEHWDDPRIIYGFFLGAIGGPSLQDDAFSGARVWTQLESNAREFVTSLRGVDSLGRQPRISPLYEDFAVLFDSPDALKAHLRTFANTDVRAHIDAIEGAPEYLRFDWNVADMTNGREGCSGVTAGMNITVIDSGGTGSNAVNCDVLPPQAAQLLNVVIQRRLEFLRNGQLGRVTVRDIPTPSDGGPAPEEPAQPVRQRGDGDVIINLPSRDDS